MGQTGELLSHNVYAYCANNPVMMCDPSGQCFMLITGLIGAAVGAIAGGLIAAANGEDPVKGALIGAAVGGLAGLTCGAASALVATGGATAFASTGVVMGTNTMLAASGSTVMAAAEVTAVEAFSAEVIAAEASLAVPAYVNNAGSLINWAQQALQDTRAVLNLTQVKQLYDMAKQYGVKITADLAGHVGSAWPEAHIHLGNTRVHIAVAEEAIDWLSGILGY